MYACIHYFNIKVDISGFNLNLNFTLLGSIPDSIEIGDSQGSIICTATHIYTYVQLYIHTNIHEYAHTCIHTYMHSYIYTYVHTYININIIIIHICLLSTLYLSMFGRHCNVLYYSPQDISTIEAFHLPSGAFYIL